MGESEQAEGGFDICVPFIIDGDAYSDRDRAMFVAGYEFCQIRNFLEVNPPGTELSKPIHNENVDRVRVLCGRFRRECVIEELDGSWSQLDIL